MPLPFLLLLLPFLQPTPASSSYPTTRPGCPDRCGNLTIPYPFGTQPDCYLNFGYSLICNSTFTPPRTFLNTLTTGIFEVTSLSVSSATVSVLTSISRDCDSKYRDLIDVRSSPYALSYTRNKFTAIGCNITAMYFDGDQRVNTGECYSTCNKLSSGINGSCSGTGCCQVEIPRGLQRFGISLGSLYNSQNFIPCGHAFLVDEKQYDFQVSDLTDFYMRGRVPFILDWAVARSDDSDETCEKAPSSGDYYCGNNSYCSNSPNARGYQCTCNGGYGGNPYLGCQDINECEDPETNTCSGRCENTPGSYKCLSTKFPLVQVIVGSGLGLLFLLACGFIIYWVLKKRRMMCLKEKFFKANGGFLLQKELAAHEGFQDETARIFTAEELKRATDNYADSQILGHGGNGTVYKGILSESGHVVAIKKSHIADETQIEQFINEMVLLSQVIHKNIVRIVGCCLETQVPLLVYEYVPNGTLHYHLHARPGSLSWEARLRIAVETAGALAYLHSAIARPIFHRDVKTANILLNHNFTAKVSDFGASRMIPMDREQITTLVQGTLGYLDPEYFQTGQLTEKSDVYSFGVVLAEMMTGQKPLSGERPQAEKNLAIYFLLKIKEGKLYEILEHRVMNEGSNEQLEAISELVRQCLRLNGEERPTMREVASEIERIRRPKRDELEAVSTEEDHSMLMDEINKGIEGLESTRFYSSMITRVMPATGMTYFCGFDYGQ